MPPKIPMREAALGHEVPPEEVKATAYYIGEADYLGLGLAKEWTKDTRLRLGAFFRHPTEHALDTLSTQLSDSIINPSERQLAMVRGLSSSIAERIHPSITLATSYARTLDEIKSQTIGRSQSTKGVNALSGLVFSKTMTRAPGLTDADFEDLIRLETATVQIENAHFHWYAAKFAMMAGPLESRLKLEQYLPGIEKGEESAAELAAANDELFASLTTLQKYGVKTCIAPALSQSATKEWLIASPDYFESYPLYPDFHPIRKQLASMVGSRKPITTTENSSFELVSDYGDKQLTNIIGSKIKGIDTEKDATFICQLNQDGQLYFLPGGQKIIDVVPPEQMQQYEQLRSEILSIYFDLVVPVYVTERVKGELSEKPSGLLGKLALGLGKKKSLHRLVLARTRFLNSNFEEIEEALQDPETDMTENEQERQSRAQHDVEWYIRRLPESYKASAEQRELCLKQTGIVLAETGETYVRKHTRGTEKNESKGHRVSFVAGKIAAKRQRKK